MVAAKSVLSDLTGSGMKVRNQNAGVIAALATDDFRARQRIDPAQAGADRQWAVDPSRFQIVVVGTREIRAEQSGCAPEDVKTRRFGRVVVYTAVERIQ